MDPKPPGDDTDPPPDPAPAPAPPPEDPALKAKLTQARAALLMRYPFFGYLVMHLEDKLGHDWMQTAGTDGTWARPTARMQTTDARDSSARLRVMVGKT